MSQNISDIVLPRIDWHFVPVWNFLNLLITSINSSPQFFHFIIVSIHILTAYVVYKIGKEIYSSNIIAILAGIIFSLSYAIHIKALTWNCFHSHVTNSFTGGLALLFLIKYFKVQKKCYLISVLFLLILTILNSESGFVFLVILGIYAIYNYLNNKLSKVILLETITIIFLAFSVYTSSMMYFSGNPFPIFIDRASENSNQQLTEKIVGMRQNGGKLESDSATPSLNISEMRSTYAPRTIPVLLLRTIDLTMKITNLSIIEDVAKSRLYDSLLSEEKTSFKEKIRPLLKIGFVIAGIVLVFIIPLIIYVGYHTLRIDTYPFLLILICLFPVFVVVFNRVDIANSVAIFSSIIMADLFLSSRNKNKVIRYFCGGIIVVFVGLASVAIFDGFENTYFQNKTYRIKIHSIYNEINEKIGGYSDSALILVDEESTLAHPAMNYDFAIPWADLSHYNAVYYKNEFMDTPLSHEYKHRSFNEFASAKELSDNVQAILIKELGIEIINQNKGKYSHVIHVNDEDYVSLLKTN